MLGNILVIGIGVLVLAPIIILLWCFAIEELGKRYAKWLERAELTGNEFCNVCQLHTDSWWKCENSFCPHENPDYVVKPEGK